MRTRAKWTALAGVLALLAVAPAPAHARTDNQSKPIIFVHGIDAFDISGFGVSCDASWDKMMRALKGSWGWTGTFHPVRYYHKDGNCSYVYAPFIDHHGNHTAYGSGGHTGGSHTGNATIEHLSYHFAWFLYDHFTKGGVTVDIVAHSMGGLITRHAIAAVSRGSASFPPQLRVEDVVTFGTPHNGVSVGCCTTQATQMDDSSSFMNWLRTYAKNPQGYGGTDWTVTGAGDDDLVEWNSAVAMSANHKVKYYSGQGIEHGSYMLKTSTSANAHATYSDFGGTWYQTYSFYWPVRMSHFAMLFGSW